MPGGPLRAAVTTWELRDGSSRQEQWFRLSVYGHPSQEANFCIWRSSSQVIQLQEDLARRFSGYQPSALLRAHDTHTRALLTQQLLGTLTGHILFLNSPQVNAFLEPTASDRRTYRALRPATLSASCDAAAAETRGSLVAGSVISSLEARPQELGMRLRCERGWVSTDSVHLGCSLLWHEPFSPAVSNTVAGYYRVLHHTAVHDSSRGARKIGSLEVGELVEVQPGSERSNRLALLFNGRPCWAHRRTSTGSLRLLKERDLDVVGVEKSVIQTGWVALRCDDGAHRKRWLELHGDTKHVVVSLAPSGEVSGTIDMACCTSICSASRAGSSELEIDISCRSSLSNSGAECGNDYVLRFEEPEEYKIWLKVLKRIKPGAIRNRMRSRHLRNQSDSDDDSEAEEYKSHGEVEAVAGESHNAEKEEEADDDDGLLDEASDDLLVQKMTDREILLIADGQDDTDSDAEDGGEKEEAEDAMFWAAEDAHAVAMGSVLQVDEIVQNQRHLSLTAEGETDPDGSDQYSASALWPTERPEWSNVHGHSLAPPDHSAPPPDGWMWLGPWTIETEDGGMPLSGKGLDADRGWEYCHEWSGWPRLWHSGDGHGQDPVRRRRLFRLRQSVTWRKDPATEEEQQSVLKLHRGRRRQLERGVCMLQRMERGMLTATKCLLHEKMRQHWNPDAIASAHGDADAIVHMLEHSPKQTSLALVKEQDSEDTRSVALRVYTQALSCVVGGRLSSRSEIPASLTNNSCSAIMHALVPEELQSILDVDVDAQIAVAMDCFANIQAELERQLLEIQQDQHPVYTRDAFLSGPKVGDQYEGWKLKREQEITRLLTSVKRLPVFSGRLVVRVTVASGLPSDQDVSLRFRLGKWKAKTKVVRTDSHGVAKWDETVAIDLDSDPVELSTVQSTRSGDKKPAKDALVVELLRGSEGQRKIIAGSKRHDGTRLLWLPPPHFCSRVFEIKCGWRLYDGRTKHDKHDTTVVVCCATQYSFTSRRSAPEISGISSSSMGDFRYLVEALQEFTNGVDPETVSPQVAFTWLQQTYAEYFGISDTYRQLYSLRVQLSKFSLCLHDLVPLTIAFDSINQQLVQGCEWAIHERSLYDQCLLHIEEVLSEAFISINASFDDPTVLKASVDLFHKIMFSRDQEPDDLLLELLFLGADHVMDAVLGYGELEPTRVATAFHVVELLIQEFDTILREGLPATLPDKVILYYLSRCETALHISAGMLSSHWQDSLEVYRAALALQDLAEHLLETQFPKETDLTVYFAPTFEAFVVSNTTRLSEWASEAVTQDKWTPVHQLSSVALGVQEGADDSEDDILTLGLHSTGANDLVVFLVRAMGEFDEMATLLRKARVVSSIVTAYCTTISQQCKCLVDNSTAADTAENRAYEAVYCVRINNVYVLSDHRLAKFAMEPEAILPVFDSGCTEEDLEAISNTFTECQASTRRQYRALIDTLVHAKVLEIHHCLSQLNGDEDSDATELIWGECLAIIDCTLAIAAEALYQPLFVRLLRQLATETLGYVNGILTGDLTGDLVDSKHKLYHWSGRQLARMFKPGVGHLERLFLADGAGVDPSVVDTLVQPLNTLLATHQTPTDILMLKYNTLQEATSTQDIDEATKREASDRLQRIVTVLQLRASGRHVCENAGDYSGELAVVAQRDTLAQQFMLELGTQAYGAAPSSLQLPAEEKLVAQVKCHLNGEIGVMYVTDSWVCFRVDLDTLEIKWRANTSLTAISAMERRWHHCSSPMEAVEKLEALDLHVASQPAEPSPGVVIQCPAALGIADKSFGSATEAATWIRDDMLQAAYSSVRLRIADIQSARRDATAEDRRGEHVVNADKVQQQQRRRRQQQLELCIDQHWFHNFESFAARDGVLAHLQRRAQELGVELGGRTIRYSLSLVTAADEMAALNPSNCGISVVFVGATGTSPEILLRPSSRATVQPGGVLTANLEVPVDAGEVTSLAIALVPKGAVTSLFKTKPKWDVGEVRLINTHSGQLAHFGGVSLQGGEPTSIRPDSGHHAALEKYNSSSSAAATDVVPPPPPPPRLSTVIEEIWENERRKPLKHGVNSFSATHLRASDPPPWSDGLGRARLKESVILPAASLTDDRAWEWVTEWEVEGHSLSPGSGVVGSSACWEYSRAFSASSLGGAWEVKMARTSMVRRRKWFRIRKAK